MKSTFYGWRVVAACTVFATIGWSLGTFGMGVYIYALTDLQGFSISTVSTAVTSAYVISAMLMLGVGRFIARYGPRPVTTFGALALAAGVCALPYCQSPWHLYMAFITLGVGMSCLTTNMIGSTLAPWFERYQGRAMSMAMLGASIGGMIGTPLLMGGIRMWGFATTMTVAGLVAIAVVWPLTLFVVRTRPQDVGQLPDGLPVSTALNTSAPVTWTLKKALGTRQLQSQVLAFGLAFMVQVGFLSHHVSIAIPIVGVSSAAMAVFLAAVAAFMGRLLLARYADRINIRITAAGVFIFGGLALAAMSMFTGAWAFMGLSIMYGLTVGNVTTLAPMVIRKEFGAASFGAIFGFAAALNQLAMAMGPSFYGLLRDALGGYGPVLLLCAGLNVLAAVVVYWGGVKKRSDAFS